MSPPRLFMTCLLVSSLSLFVTRSHAQILTDANYDRLVPAGKEIDAIVGDAVLNNAMASAVIAQPIPTRNSNMTVRNVGGCLIDFAFGPFESDQLSAFYPGRRVFPFSKMTFEDQSLVVTAQGTADRPTCEVRYQLNADRPSIEIRSTWTNTMDQDWPVKLEDDVRIDGGNEDLVKAANGAHDLFFANDRFWQQAYGLRAPGFRIRCEGDRRNTVLTYEPLDGALPTLKPGESFTLIRELIVHRHLTGIHAIVEQIAGRSLVNCDFTLVDALGRAIPDARLEFRQDKTSRGMIRTDASGHASVSLPAETYSLVGTSAGHPLFSTIQELKVAPNQTDIRLDADNYRPGLVKAVIVDDLGQPIPAKVEFIGHSPTTTPNWGPDSAEHFVRNLAYTENGQFGIPLQSGQYDVIASHGPEYDAVFTRITVEPGQTVELNATLKHSVQTPGWVSSDFHSHSSPSGDNTGSQLGRVLNLAAEQIEFAPCTEHNRISTYQPIIDQLNLQHQMATVSGMELTGSPLPLNHQNVFPMKHVPHTQDGGGPVTDADPQTQIERATLWDDRSEKLVQQNHPDLGWLFYDKDGDGSPDEGFQRSFRLMDVMEIHPIDRILNPAPFELNQGQPSANQTMFNWLQLLNQGHRIYGVVNTDAHYNYHGSGWLRNWIQSSTDDPAKIDFMEMVHASEQGRLIMSNGPYLEASFESAEGEPVVSGQDLTAPDGQVTVHVRVQCPNWIDVDTVFLLINGRVADQHVYTRKDHPELFGDGVLKFDQTWDVPLESDSHLIVVTGSHRTTLGDVMGPSGGTQHPAALTNPVFVDVDGKGFSPNRDTLGQPLPVKFRK